MGKVLSDIGVMNSGGSSIEIESLYILTPPKKLTYMIGESFDQEGMRVEVRYSNGAYKEVQDYTWEPTGPLTESDNTVTIRYKEQSVTAATAVPITVSPYIRLQYIGSNGTQYIDTGYKPNSNTKVRMKAEFTPDGKNMFLFGGRTGQNSKTFCFSAYTNNCYRAHFYNGWSDFANTVTFFDPFEIYHKGAHITLTSKDDVSYSVEKTGAQTFSGDYSMYLFALNQAGILMNPATAKIYSCRIEEEMDGGIGVVMDLIPCKNATGEVGMYDIINGKFYGNAGSGDFIPGTEM